MYPEYLHSPHPNGVYVLHVAVVVVDTLFAECEVSDEALTSHKQTMTVVPLKLNGMSEVS